MIYLKVVVVVVVMMMTINEVNGLTTQNPSNEHHL